MFHAYTKLERIHGSALTRVFLYIFKIGSGLK
jgi:hypothetical protein